MTIRPQKPGFYWNPSFNAELTSDKRKLVADHERLHLQYAIFCGGFTADQAQEVGEAIDAFERGDAPKEPIEGTCVFVFPEATNSRDAATEALRVVDDYVTNKPE